MCHYALVAHRGCGHIDILTASTCPTRMHTHDPASVETVCDTETRIGPTISEAGCWTCRHPEQINRFVGIDERSGEDNSEPTKKGKPSYAAEFLMLCQATGQDAEDQHEEGHHPGERRQSPERPRAGRGQRDGSRAADTEERARSQSRGRDRHNNRRAMAAGRFKRSRSQQSRKRSVHAPRGSGEEVPAEELPVPGPGAWITEEWLQSGWKAELVLLKVLETRVFNLRPHCLLLPYGISLQQKMRSLKYVEAFIKKEAKEEPETPDSRR